ncbi:MAG: DUF192 domain-containing protein [Phycisphaerae bacterium]|jgi:uncharacterized membrane protein (UPF0127 family)
MRGIRSGTVAGLLLCGTLAAFLMNGCDDKTTPDSHAKVTIAGRTFSLEVAADDKTRFHGLSDRTKIDPDGGMFFVFKKPSELEFVMRDCPIPIDIIFVDGSGRVTAFHKMTPEAPRSEAEKQLSPPFKDAPSWTWTNAAYEARLKRYPSKFAAQYVIELAGNTLDSLKIKQNDQIEFDRAAMKKLAK